MARWRRIQMLLGCALVTACAGLRSTPETRYQGIMLNARNLGAEQVRNEMARDPRVRAYIERDGSPDYILVAAPDHLELVYYQASRLAHFSRDPVSGQTTVAELAPLPTPLVNVLQADLRAGTPGPLDPDAPLTNCWSVETNAGRCRTCCVGSLNCSMSCA